MKTRPRPRSGTEQLPFRPNMHVCLRACKKTTTKRKKRIPYQQHPRPRIRTKLLKEKNTPLCARSDPPPAFPTFASQAGAAACSAFVSQPAYTPPHTPTQTTRKKKKTRARKTHASFFAFGGGIPAGAYCTAGGTLTPPPPFSSLLHILPRAA